MTDKFKKLINILNNLGLSDQERTDFLNVLLFVPDKDYNDVMAEIEKDPQLIREVLDNYQKKQEILKKGNTPEFQQMVQTEEPEMKEN